MCKSIDLSGVPVLIADNHAMKGDREKCLAAGMDEYVSKPIKAKEVFRVIEKLTDGLEKKGKDSLSSKRVKRIVTDVFDLSRTLEAVDGDIELFKEIAELFLEDLPDSMTQIRESISKNDANALELTAHSLKGSVGNFGAKRAFDAAYRLEVMGKEGRPGETDAAMSKLQSEIKDLETAMQTALRETTSEGADS
jgi:HPt (histidine-containing phosphotransfer) domain-containing protein